jgi:putative intracellular protease/amidase
VFTAERRGEVRTENGFLGLTADAAFDEVPAPDVVLVPGGIGTRRQLDGPLVEWVRAVHPGPGSPRRSAPARSCSPRPGCSTG